MKEFEGYSKGINLGGWLSQCCHTKEHYKSFINESDIAKIAKWGFDHVRLPIDAELVMDQSGSFIEDGFSYIDSCISWCRENKLNMILDLHKTNGYSFDESCNSFFERPKLQEQFVCFWDQISKKYGEHYDMLAFELLNEVVEKSYAEPWNKIAARAVAVIRKNAPMTKIIIGGVQNNSVLWVDKLDTPYDKNIVYTFHLYEPLIFTHQGAYWIDDMPEDFRIEYPESRELYEQETENCLSAEQGEFLRNISSSVIDKEFFRKAIAGAISYAEKKGVPLYCGEMGVIDRAAGASAVRWFEDVCEVLSENHIGYAMWNYRGKDFGLSDEHYKEFLPDIIKAACGI